MYVCINIFLPDFPSFLCSEYIENVICSFQTYSEKNLQFFFNLPKAERQQFLFYEYMHVQNILSNYNYIIDNFISTGNA
jgi:hypothetical protein